MEYYLIGLFLGFLLGFAAGAVAASAIHAKAIARRTGFELLGAVPRIPKPPPLEWGLLPKWFSANGLVETQDFCLFANSRISTSGNFERHGPAASGMRPRPLWNGLL